MVKASSRILAFFHPVLIIIFDTGNHPELLHLHKELSKRRDKRIELATRKRAYEVANVTKRRRVDEDATWSWWKVSFDRVDTVLTSLYDIFAARER